MIDLIIFGLLAVGMVLVIYGTIAKNSWGINPDPVYCPRCNAPFPQIRQPQNIRQRLWGGWTCTKCGAEVDKWGREVASHKHPHPPASIQPEGQMRRAFKRKLVIFTAVGSLCLTPLFDWLGTGRHPSTVGGWMVFAGTAAAEAMVFTILFYFASMYLLDRFFFKKAERGA